MYGLIIITSKLLLEILITFWDEDDGQWNFLRMDGVTFMAIEWLKIRIRMLRATLSYVMTALFLNRDNNNNAGTQY